MLSAATCRNFRILCCFGPGFLQLGSSLFKPQVSPADVSIGQLYQLLPIKSQFDMPVAHQALVHKLFEIRAPINMCMPARNTSVHRS